LHGGGKLFLLCASASVFVETLSMQRKAKKKDNPILKKKKNHSQNVANATTTTKKERKNTRGVSIWFFFSSHPLSEHIVFLKS
jgi:hypothetical protein